ncbi:MAG: malate dehydrogenase, partial [Acidithiobacillales bacterium SM23_46]
MGKSVRPSPSYSFTVRVRYPNHVGMLGKVTSVIGEAGGDISAVDIAHVSAEEMTRDLTVAASDFEHGKEIVKAIGSVPEVAVVNVSDRTFLRHLGGKLETVAKRPIKTRDDLSMTYTPGVARICLAIQDDPRDVFNLTIKRNTVAVVTDGSAVLGLGNIGPEAALPVMEGKAVLFKEFGGVDAFPLCLATQDVDEIVETVVRIAPVFGGINLEDISAPRCFEIEERLRERLDIPVFHDDQHGTAVVVLAALLNALKLIGKELSEVRIAISGAGAAGVACAKLLLHGGSRDLVVCDRQGIINRRRDELNPAKRWLAENTNSREVEGSLADALRGADVFIGVSAPGIVTAEMIKEMAEDAIVFAMSNPDPEIMPEEAEPLVRVMATGRSDYPNQINNVLCFPGFFRGLLDCRAAGVNYEMKRAAA